MKVNKEFKITKKMEQNLVVFLISNGLVLNDDDDKRKYAKCLRDVSEIIEASLNPKLTENKKPSNSLPAKRGFFKLI